jgi:Sulfate permease family
LACSPHSEDRRKGGKVHRASTCPSYQQQFVAHASSGAAGARTQLTGVVGALSVALLLVAAPNLLKDLPAAALAAVVIVSLSIVVF